MLLNYIKTFTYHLKQNKLFSFLNVLGLAIGISGLIFALLYWNDEKNYDSWNPEKENVYQVLVNLTGMPILSNNPVRLRPNLEKDSNIKSILFADEWYQKDKIIYNGKKEVVDKIVNAQSSFFSFFPFEIVQGNGVSALNDSNSMAISDDLSKRLFGEANAIGKQIKYLDEVFTVRAVYHIPGNSSVAPNIVISKMKDLMDPVKNGGIFELKLLLKIKDPSKVEATRLMIEKTYYNEVIVPSSKETGFTLKEMEEKMGHFTVYMEPLSTARLHSLVDGYPEGRGNYQFLMIMMGLSILILILSIVNYINLATANAIKRAKEVGVRKIVGATKGNIIVQFVFETALITTISILLALVIVELSLPYYNNFLNKNLVLIGGQFSVQLALIFVITIVVAGILPAVYVANFETLKVLKGNYGRSKNGIWLRNGMLIFQFSVAAFFIIGSNIVYEQIEYLSNKDLGFKGDQVIAVPFNLPNSEYEGTDPGKNIYHKYTTIQQELGKINGVEGTSTGLICFDASDNSLAPLLYKEILFKVHIVAIDYDFLNLMKIKIKKGRNFDQKLASDTINTVLLNETAQKLLVGTKDVLGEEVEIRSKKLNVIGIVKDFNTLSPESAVIPMAFYHFKTLNSEQYINTIFIKIKSDNIEKSIAEIEHFWSSKVDKENPFKYDFVDKQYARTYESYIKQKNLFSLLNVVVILIALFGLFALASYSIQRRMKEIAIRKTLGAETNTLLKELSKQYVLYCITGFVIALFPAYYLLNKWLENFAFRIDISVYPFFLGFVILLALTLTIVLSKAYQATKTDILKYLKYE